jgi:hypothetical protein
MKIINKPFVKKYIEEFLGSQGKINQNAELKKRHNVDELVKTVKMA